MPGWAVIPTIRVPDMAEALRFYQEILGFELDRGDVDQPNNSLTRGDARIMLEVPTDFYSAGYNEAIAARLGGRSPMALYIEAPDLEELYDQIRNAGVTIADPIADRPWGQAEFTVEDHMGNWITFWKATNKG